MANVFISHAEEDLPLARALAASIESEGHHAWHFTRDSKPAEIYVNEISTAIGACDLVILMVSHPALDSYHIDKEVLLCYEQQKKILPILIGVKADDISRRRPNWKLVIGTCTHLKCEASQLSDIVPGVVQACHDAGGAPSDQRAPAWTSDSLQIDIESLDRVVFQTPLVKRFIDGQDQFFISANKGIGKTLLLKCKRARLMELHTKGNGRAELLFIPSGRPYLDFMGGGLPSLKKPVVGLLSDLRACQRIWSFAIRAAILAHVPGGIEKLPGEQITEAAGVSFGTIVPRGAAVTTVFRACLDLPRSTILRLLDRVESPLEYAFRGIHTGVCTFIDRVEQGAASLPPLAWINVQAGLVEAAWDVMSSNSHVKVYATIREEAFASYESDSKANLATATLGLRYSTSELHGMIDQLCGLYEASTTFSRFVGCDRVRGNDGTDEDTFDHALRHTVGRPRDLIVLCHAVSNMPRDMAADGFRRVVRDTAAKVIAGNVFAEMAPFLDCLGSVEERRRLYALLPADILTRDEIERVCMAFNELSDTSYGVVRAAGASLRHPLCELFKCGLVGTVDSGLDGSMPIQQFKQPHDIVTCGDCCLPMADLYLLHPSLTAAIRAHRGNDGFLVCRGVVVGHRQAWRKEHSALVAFQKALNPHREHDLGRRIAIVLEEILSSRGGERPAAAERGFASFDGVLEEQGLDDVWLAFDRLRAVLGAEREPGGDSHSSTEGTRDRA